MSQPSLSASKIFDAEDLKIVEEHVPEWKQTIYLRQLDAEESLALMTEMELKDKAKDGMFISLIYCACESLTDRTPIFTMEDLPRIRKKSIQVLNRLQRISLKLNSMDPKAAEAAKNDSSVAATAGSPTS